MRRLSAEAGRIARSIQRAFPSALGLLRWPAFQTYVLLSLCTCCRCGALGLSEKITGLKTFLLRFTMSIRDLHDLSYVERLRKAVSPTTGSRMTYGEMLFTCTYLQGQCQCAATFALVSNTRGNGHRLQHRHSNYRVSHFVLSLLGINFLLALLHVPCGINLNTCFYFSEYMLLCIVLQVACHAVICFNYLLLCGELQVL